MWRDGLRLALVAFAAASCPNDWRTDMWYQPSIGPQPRMEPEHSVPLGAVMHLEDRDQAEGLGNPIPVNGASIERGKWLFGERCACCHGKSGHGGGPVSTFFPPAPDLAYTATKARSDGYIFGTISLGGRAMPPEVVGLTERDRWDLVNYVRLLQNGTSDGAGP